MLNGAPIDRRAEATSLESVPFPGRPGSVRPSDEWSARAFRRGCRLGELHSKTSSHCGVHVTGVSSEVLASLPCFVRDLDLDVVH